VEKIPAAQHGPTRALYFGLIITIVAVLAYATYITMQFSGIRKLQSGMVDRNRKDSLQLLRIQNDVNSIGLAMRDMLDAGEPYPLRSVDGAVRPHPQRSGRGAEAGRKLGGSHAHQRPAPLPQPA
jgi:hypothetical protein